MGAGGDGGARHGLPDHAPQGGARASPLLPPPAVACMFVLLGRTGLAAILLACVVCLRVVLCCVSVCRVAAQRWATGQGRALVYCRTGRARGAWRGPWRCGARTGLQPEARGLWSVAWAGGVRAFVCVRVRCCAWQVTGGAHHMGLRVGEDGGIDDRAAPHPCAPLLSCAAQRGGEWGA